MQGGNTEVSNAGDLDVSGMRVNSQNIQASYFGILRLILGL
jgi:hypothetical protein